MAVRRPNKVVKVKPEPPFRYDDDAVRKLREEAYKARSKPCIDLYELSGRSGPPKGHRTDCHWDQIKTKQCTCRRHAAYKKGGMAAVDRLMEGVKGW